MVRVCAHPPPLTHAHPLLSQAVFSIDTHASRAYTDADDLHAVLLVWGM